MILLGPFQLRIFCGFMSLGQPLHKIIPLAISSIEWLDVLVLEMLHNPKGLCWAAPGV